MYKHVVNTVASIIMLFLFQTQAFAIVSKCTDIRSVEMSRFVTHNNEYGGHLNAHIFGQTPPVGYSQKDRTLFWDEDAWYEAYSELENQHPPLMCNTDAPLGSEAVRTINFQFYYECTQADANGKCTRKQGIKANRVTFVLRVVQGDFHSKRWIIYTAYPHI